MTEIDTHNIPASVSDVLANISRTYGFSTFTHFRTLATLATESGIRPEEWSVALDGWDYNPEVYLEQHKRGNCVDFASFSRRVLSQEANLHCDVIGTRPSSAYTDAQRTFMRFRHTSLHAIMNGAAVLFEPGWKIPTAVPLAPLHRQTVVLPWRFTTTEHTAETIVQELVSPSGHAFTRTFDTIPLEVKSSSQLTKNLLRIPRRLEMLSPMQDEGVPDLVIGFNHKTSALTSNIDQLPNEFGPEDIPSRINQSISDIFGYDVKEELLISLGFRRALPDSFWVR